MKLPLLIPWQCIRGLATMNTQSRWPNYWGVNYRVAYENWMNLIYYSEKNPERDFNISKKIKKILAKFPAFVDLKANGLTLLYHRRACKYSVNQLLKAYADPNIIDSEGFSILDRVVMSQDFDSVELLINSGAKLSHKIDLLGHFVMAEEIYLFLAYNLITIDTRLGYLYGKPVTSIPYIIEYQYFNVLLKLMLMFDIQYVYYYGFSVAEYCYKYSKRIEYYDAICPVRTIRTIADTNKYNRVVGLLYHFIFTYDFSNIVKK
jgi:hypothetical protein